MQITTAGPFTIKSYLRSEISSALIRSVQAQTEKSFNLRRSNYNYKENYIWDELSPQSLAYKFKQNQFEMINLVFQNEDFLSFSGTYLNQNQIAFGGVRRFSAPHAPIAPYHMAYVIPIQLAYMRLLGAKAFILSYNAGVRDGFFKIISRIASRKNATGVYLDAQQMYRVNNFTERVTPVLCNSVYQRLHYCILDTSLTEDNLFKLLS